MWPFTKSKSLSLEVDIHSHLIPTVDDGSKSVENSLEMIRALSDLGYRKAVTTPHIHPKYPNTPHIIMDGMKKLQSAMDKNRVEFELEVAAEYYVDENFKKKLDADEKLLSFGNRYLLIETSFLNKPAYFEQIIFELKSKGYQPVFAHPERYVYLEGELEWLMELKAMGVMFQITIASLMGYYGKTPSKVAHQLLKKRMVDFLGSDLHRPTQVKNLKKGLELKKVQKYISEGLLKNHTLI